MAQFVQRSFLIQRDETNDHVGMTVNRQLRRKARTELDIDYLKKKQLYLEFSSSGKKLFFIFLI